MSARGTQSRSRGSLRPAAKLSEDILEWLRKSTESTCALAEKLGVVHGTISKALFHGSRLSLNEISCAVGLREGYALISNDGDVHNTPRCSHADHGPGLRRHSRSLH